MTNLKSSYQYGNLEENFTDTERICQKWITVNENPSVTGGRFFAPTNGEQTLYIPRRFVEFALRSIQMNKRLKNIEISIAIADFWVTEVLLLIETANFYGKFSALKADIAN